MFRKRFVRYFIIFVLTYVDISIIGRGVDARWLPAVGFGLGLGLTCIGFWAYKEFSKLVTMKVATREKIAVISGLSLSVLGIAFIVVNNSIALILNVDWLYGSRFISAFILFWIGFWIVTLFSEVFNDFRLWKYIGLGINGLLIVCVVAKFYGYGW